MRTQAAERRTPSVSVLIPTYQRRELVLHTLDHLGEQSLPTEEFEVIVADDGSSDGTPQAIEADATNGRWPFPVAALALEHQGPAHARNEAARAARAPILAFLDSDVEPDPGWLEAGLGAFQSDRVGAVEGRTEIGPGTVTPFTHQTQSHGGGYPTCNLLVRKVAFDEVGGFDSAFGGKYFFREDTDLAFRLMDAGYEIPYAPEALVLHPPLPASVWTPLKLARRYRYEPLFWQRHPGRCRTTFGRQKIGPLTVPYPRHFLYGAHLLAALVALGALLAGLRGVAATATAVYALTLAGVVLLHLWHSTPTWRTAVHAFFLLPLALLVPWVFAYSIAEGVGLARASRSRWGRPAVRPDHATNHPHAHAQASSRSHGENETVPSPDAAPALTLVTVGRNAANALEETIASVASQVCDSLEYVIVDGGSADGTLEIIRRHEKTIDRWISEPDRGIYDAMNKGVRLAHGRWIHFLNAGDRFVSPDTCEEALRHLQNGWAFGYGTVVRNRCGVRDEIPSPVAVTEAFLRQSMVCHQAIFARRADLLAHPFDLRYHLAADLDWVLGVLQRGETCARIPVTVCELLAGGVSEAPSLLLDRYRVHRARLGRAHALLSFVCGAGGELTRRVLRLFLGNARYYRVRQITRRPVARGRELTTRKAERAKRCAASERSRR